MKYSPSVLQYSGAWQYNPPPPCYFPSTVISFDSCEVKQKEKTIGTFHYSESNELDYAI